MSIWLDKPWLPLTSEAITALPAQLGVYEVADDDGNVVRIGYAGGRETFGIRTALERELAGGSVTRFRLEFNHGYMSRWEELLMAHMARHGSLPAANAAEESRIGRLHP